MPSESMITNDVEHSFSYASYERASEVSFLYPDKKSRKFLSNSTLSQQSTEESNQDGDAKLASRSRGIVILVACLFLNMSCFGMVVVLGVVYVELISAFDCPRSEAALVQSLYMGLSLSM